MAANYLHCDAYLFDIDGTLMNVRDGTHYHAFHHAVRDVFGVDSSIDGVPVHGNTDIGILRAVLRRAGLSDDEFESRLPAAIEHMCNEVAANAKNIRPELCPSVLDLLEKLSGANRVLGVVSGNLERIGWLKLKAAHIRDYFAFGCFSDHAELRADIFRNGMDEVRSRIGDAASICVVGDTPSDVSAAQQLGIPVIAVATGTYDTKALATVRPDACFSCCTDFLSLL